MEKTGSHVGVVLSFVIFITFIIFLYVIIQPTIKQGGKQNFIEHIKGEIIERISTDLTSISVTMNAGPQTCVELRDFFTITEISDRVIVKNDAGSVLNALKNGNSLFVPKNSNDFFIKIHESEEFDVIADGTINPCQPLSEGSSGYTIGLVKTNKQIFETKIIKLISDYKNDYETLKEMLGVAPGDEFGFSFTYSNENIIKTEEKNISVSVYVSEIPIQYISKNAAREQGSLNIKAW